MHHSDKVPIAGRLAQYLVFWKTLTKDQYILNAIKGYRIEFVNNMPVQRLIPKPINFSQKETLAIDATIQSLQVQGVIRLCKHEPGEYINTIFVREKRDKKEYRMILNLKLLNKHVEYQKFKMDTLKTVVKLIKKHCFMASIDIKDAYYTVKIDDDYQKFLKFTWHGKLYQYTCLPNGLSSAPRLFTKLLKPILARIRSLGHMVCFGLVL